MRSEAYKIAEEKETLKNRYRSRGWDQIPIWSTWYVSKDGFVHVEKILWCNCYMQTLDLQLDFG